MGYCCGLTQPAARHHTAVRSPSPLPLWDGGEKWENEVWDRDSLLRQGNNNNDNSSTTNNVYKQVMHNAIAHHLLTNVQPDPEQCLSLPSAISPQFYCWARCHVVWDIPLVTLGQLSSLCPLPAPGAPPAPLLSELHEKQNSPWLCASTVLQLKHRCVITTVFTPNPKHSTIPATRRKINSILAETRTLA